MSLLQNDPNKRIWIDPFLERMRLNGVNTIRLKTIREMYKAGLLNSERLYKYLTRQR